MKKKYKIVAFIITIIGILYCTYAGNKEKNLNEGDEVENELITSNKGKLVFVNFWASYDAASIDKNIRFSKTLKKYQADSSLATISVSLDNYRAVYNDAVKNNTLYYTTVTIDTMGFRSEIAKTFCLKENEFNNYLIDKDGKLIAKNIEPEELEEKLQEDNKK